MNLCEIRKIFQATDGALPDITFDFGKRRMVGDAYALIQGRATHLASEHAYYWSRSKGEECVIQYGDNPALHVKEGAADGFHVVFGGLRSPSGMPLPDLGVAVLTASCLALDYKMGPAWDELAIVGLFEIMQEINALSDEISISHVGDIFDLDGHILLAEFNNWQKAKPA